MQIFSIVLAFIWAIILGVWLRDKAPAHAVLKASFVFKMIITTGEVSLLIHTNEKN